MRRANQTDLCSEGKKLLDKELADRKALIARGGTPKGGKEFSLRLIGLRLSNLRDERATQDAGKLDSVSVKTSCVRRPGCNN